MSDNSSDLDVALDRVAGLCARLSRQDLVDEIERARARLMRESAVVVVIGDYKQGKSSFVNALIGMDICPVDADFATASLTLLTHRPTYGALVHLTTDNGREAVETPVDDLANWVWERRNPGNRKNVDLVEVFLPNPVLEAGLTIIDTPGLGGFGRAQREATLRFLELADAFVFVADSSAELNSIDAKYLQEAVGACGAGFLAVSKTDLYPAWEKIVALNRGHLDAIGIDIDIIPLSSTLRLAALETQDARLNLESGFEVVLSWLREVVAEGREQADARVVSDALGVLDKLSAQIEEATEVLANPGSATRRLGEAHKRVEALKSASARWQVVLNDGIADMRAEADYELRTLIRNTLEQADHRIDEIDPAGEWATFTEDLIADLAADVAELLNRINQKADEIANQIASLLTDEARGPGLGTVDFSPQEIWDNVELEPDTDTPGVLATGLTALRGAQGGIILLGMVARFVGFAGLLPVTLGVGLVFGVKQMFDERKRQLERRRTEAKRLVRRFTEKVSTELSRTVSDTVRTTQREFRDHFVDRLQQLQRTISETLRVADDAANAEAEERKHMEAALDEASAEIDECRNLVFKAVRETT